MPELRGVWCGSALLTVGSGGQALSGPAGLKIAHGRIAEVLHQRPTDMTGWLDVPDAIAAPGLFDIQVNGALGASFQAQDEDRFETIIGYHLERGTTALLPTLVTAPEPVLLQSLKALSAFIAGWKGACSLPGIHLEGPFLAPEKAGAHDPAALRLPDLAFVERLLTAANGTLKLVTLAPELPGAIPLIELFVRSGVAVSIGHSAATYDCVSEAVNAGATLVTHAGNASDWPHRTRQPAGFMGSEPGVVGALMAHKRLQGGVIFDGYHMHPALLAPLHAIKGTDGLILVSDASTVTGLPPGDYASGGLHARVDARGFATSLRGTTLDSAPFLAGSVITLADAVSRAVSLGGIDRAAALSMATGTPAQALGLVPSLGNLQAGAQADVCLFDHSMKLLHVITGGKTVSTQPA